MVQQIRVLMVDDEKQFRITTQKLLQKRGFDTILAENGQEAIKRLEENPDVIILDIKMPGMDGHEVLREIKKKNRTVPVIMLTGHGDLESAKVSLEEEAFDYLTKPCDINILTLKIEEAYQSERKALRYEEKKVREVMIPIDEYTKIYIDQNVKDAIMALKKSFLLKIATSKIMETGHRSILVMDSQDEVQGILSINDLLKAMMPAYLNAPKPSTADSVQYSPMFWKGMFTRAVRDLVKVKVHEIMSIAPLTIADDSNLMEAAYMIITNKVRRLLVVKSGEVIGIIREQDLFFEIEKIQRGAW